MQARIRCQPEDFRVTEQLGFAPSGEGEHVFLFLEKRQLNTVDLVQRLSELSATPPRDIGYCGLKDRNAVTRQWFSVGLAGRAEPDWQAPAAGGEVRVIAVTRHQRKLRRGVHRANQFTLVLRALRGDRAVLEQRLQVLRDQGVPNYFGEQRFGRGGSTWLQARRWAMDQQRRISRQKRSLLLSALRAGLFNTLLAARVRDGTWNRICEGDVCILHGTHSRFTCEQVDIDIQTRQDSGDLHPGLPLWGRGASPAGAAQSAAQQQALAGNERLCAFLEEEGLALDWRPARLMADDFCWRFCDDDTLQLEFALGAGSYATALLAELGQYTEGELVGDGSQQG